LLQLRVEDPTVPTFAGFMVANTGPYYVSGWWWYYGVDADALGTLLDQRTPISIDPYIIGSDIFFAAIMVDNVVGESISWWWYYGYNVTEVDNLLNANNAQLVSARPYVNDVGTVYVVIMESPAETSQWNIGQSLSTINATLTTNGDRILSFAPDGGSWDTIFVPVAGQTWWWWTDLDPTTVSNNVASHGSVITDLSSYLDSTGARRYAGVELAISSSNSSSGSSTSSTSSSSTQTGASSDHHVDKSSKSRQTNIIIGVVCGFVGVAIIAAVAFLLLRRKSKPVETGVLLSAPESESPGVSQNLLSTPEPTQTVGYPNSPQPMVQTASTIIQPPSEQVGQSMAPVVQSLPDMTSYHQYGYVPPTDAIFMQGQHFTSIPQPQQPQA
jgi:hypothetical protein